MWSSLAWRNDTWDVLLGEMRRKVRVSNACVPWEDVRCHRRQTLTVFLGLFREISEGSPAFLGMNLDL